MKLLVSEKPGNEELKCYITLAYTGATFTVGASDPKYAGCGPQVAVTTKQGTASVVFSANAVCRYIGLEKNVLQVEDLAVEDWIQWESHVLGPWIAKSKKNPNADKKELAKSLTILLEQKEETRANKTDSIQFLFGNELSLADIVVGVTLRAAMELVGTEQTPILTKFSAYLKELFALPAFVKGLSLLQSGGKPASKLDKTQMSGTTQHNVLAIVEAIFSEALQNAFPAVKDLPAVEVTRTKSASFGDYQCNSAMTIFGKLKGTPNAPRSPRDVAQAIINNIPSNPVVEKPSVAGPGFINVFLTENFLTNRIETVLRNGVKSIPSKKMTISVDFSSPNIAKDMHVGHLRSTIIGDAMARILEFQGHHVNRINHVGDWGTQFGMLICHLMDTFPDWESKMPNVTDLTQLYKAAKQRFDEDEDFHQRSKQQVVLLQGGDKQSRRVWTTLCEISRKEFQKVYDRLQVRLTECGESFYNQHIPSVIEKIKAKGITEDSDGALVVFTEKLKQPFMLLKSDGSYLYDTTDIAALWYRLYELKSDWIIIYTDYTQNDHFKLLLEVGKMSGIYDPSIHRVNHIGFGTVNDESGKRFKTRSGEVVRLVELLDEAKDRMKTQLLQRIEEGQTSLPKEEVDAAAAKIGYAAVKYFDLRQSPTSNYVFSYDRMLSTNGDTAVYLLFAYARLKSIIRRADVDMEALKKKKGEIKPVHEAERALAMELLQFQDVLTFINKDLMSNRLCAYLYSLSEKVQTWVTSCRVIGSEEQNSRLLLAEATTKVMFTCFSLLGIEPLDQI